MAVTLLDLNSTGSPPLYSPLENGQNISVNRSTFRPNYYTNITYVDFYLHEPFVSAIFIVSYLLIFIVCMMGNGVVCFIVLRSKNMRTVTNLFILNLAISDLLVGIFCMPTTLVDNIITGWPFGSLVCKLSGMVQGISVSASVFTLVAIAVDRFRCIVYPFKQKLTISTSTLIIIIIWVLAISIMCPSGVMLQVTKEHRVSILLSDGNTTQPFYWCRENWPNQEMRKIYTTVLFSLTAVLLRGHHEFIFHLLSSLSSYRQGCALLFFLMKFKTIIEPDRQSQLEGLKSRHRVPQTQKGHFVDLVLT